MNHLESTFTGKNNFWRYLVMFLLIIVAVNTIGSLPLLIAGSLRSVADPEVFSRLSANPGNLSFLGLNENIALSVMLFPFIAGLFAFILTIKPLHSRKFMETINGTGKFRWKRFFISAAAWFILSAAYLIFYMKTDPSNFSINNSTSSLIVLSLISFILIPFQAAFEEILFRGYLMQGFAMVIRNRLFPLVMTSVLFALMHSMNPEVKNFGFITMMPQYILFGLIFGVITILDDGIEAAMGAHGANNIFLCIMVTNNSSALQTPALYEQHNINPWAEFTGLLITGIFFILILKLIFKWNDFSMLYRKVEPAETVIQTP